MAKKKEKTIVKDNVIYNYPSFGFPQILIADIASAIEAGLDQKN